MAQEPVQEQHHHSNSAASLVAHTCACRSLQVRAAGCQVRRDHPFCMFLLMSCPPQSSAMQTVCPAQAAVSTKAFSIRSSLAFVNCCTLVCQAFSNTESCTTSVNLQLNKTMI